MKQESVTSKVKSAYCFLFFFITQMSLLHYLQLLQYMQLKHKIRQKMMKKPPQKNKTKKPKTTTKKKAVMCYFLIY